mmetsp:Transcript_178073/g.565194  ORF Transcript_178073/g.565194 Transcript_178073/m.565194 type:complete len:118 (-) Transcript_178073:267-620(-)
MFAAGSIRFWRPCGVEGDRSRRTSHIVLRVEGRNGTCTAQYAAFATPVHCLVAIAFARTGSDAELNGVDRFDLQLQIVTWDIFDILVCLVGLTRGVDWGGARYAVFDYSINIQMPFN